MIYKTLRERWKVLVITTLAVWFLYIVGKLCHAYCITPYAKLVKLSFPEKVWYYINASWDGTMEHMDLWGYIIAALTFVVSITIAGSFDKNAQKEFENLKDINSKIRDSIDELKSTNKEIMKSTSNLEDATRNIIETLPGILDESLKIVEKVKGVCDRLLIMNYTSKFGLIHSFNVRFVNQIRD